MKVKIIFLFFAAACFFTTHSAAVFTVIKPETAPIEGPGAILYITVTGAVQPSETTALTAPESGRIFGLNVKLNQQISRGELIASVITGNIRTSLNEQAKKGTPVAQDQIAAAYQLPQAISPADGFISSLTVKPNSRVRKGQVIGAVSKNMIVKTTAGKLAAPIKEGTQVVFYAADGQPFCGGYIETSTPAKTEGFYDLTIALVRGEGKELPTPGTKLTGKILSYENENAYKVANNAIVDIEGRHYLLMAKEIAVSSTGDQYSAVTPAKGALEYILPSSFAAAQKTQKITDTGKYRADREKPKRFIPNTGGKEPGPGYDPYEENTVQEPAPAAQEQITETAPAQTEETPMQQQAQETAAQETGTAI